MAASKDNQRMGTNGKSQVESAANDFLSDGKKLANALYENGMHKLDKAEDQVKEYSDELLNKVQRHPLTSVLIAAGVGFLLSTFFKK